MGISPELKETIDVQVKQEPAPADPIFDEDEYITGEVPGGEVPGIVSLSKSEMDDGTRLLKIKRLVRENEERIVYVSKIAGVTTFVIGALWMIKHLIEKDPKSDVTEKP